MFQYNTHTIQQQGIQYQPQNKQTNILYHQKFSFNIQNPSFMIDNNQKPLYNHSQQVVFQQNNLFEGK